ncbi:MAG: alpha/beta hydrolase-fold protein [Hyphomicrobiales bacterium]
MLRLLSRRFNASLLLLFAASFFSSLWWQSAHACGVNSDCFVASGDYRILLPQERPADKKIPAIIYIHGLGGSSKAVMNRNKLRRVAKKLGVAFVAVNGRAGSWSFPNGVERGKVRNEFTYFREVVSDIKKRFPIDGQKIVAAGFSIGASMTWNLACRTPDDYAGYIPLSGTMWRPQPNKCVGPVGEIYHSHGTADRIFPLEGRVVRGKRQGAILDTFELMAKQDQCTRKVIRETKSRGVKCRYHRNCDGETLRLCLDGGTHEVDTAYLLSGFREIAKARGF